MNVYIAKSNKLQIELFKNLNNLLQQYSSPLKFIFCENTFEEIDTFWTRENLYFSMSKYRKDYKISSNDFLIFLTSIKDEYNWFSSCSEEWDKNIFVSTREWTEDELISIDKKEYPIAYQISENLFQHLISKNFDDYQNLGHTETIGCINDMCENKNHIMFKLRTADICPSCSQIAKKNNLDDAIFNQIIEIIENIRFQFLHNKRAFDIFQKSILSSKLKILKELENFVTDNLENNESVIQKWIDEEDGIHRRQRAMIFGLDYIDVKREGQIHMSKRFDILAEQNNNSHVILELKSPNAKIFKIEERSNGNGGKTTDYSISNDLARAIPQILSYKYWYNNNLSPEQIESLGINCKKNISECIIVIGQRQQNDEVWIRNFEELKKNISIKILTYNDLIDKMKNTISNIEYLLK